MKRKKMNVSIERKIYTYVYHYHSAAHLLELAEAVEEGRFYSCMSANISCAFCIEAYLNHVGSSLISYWNTLEKPLNSKEKLEVLKGHYPQIKTDFSRRPFQTFNTIFKFRNAIAHGKTELLREKGVQELADGEMPKQPETDWEALCDLPHTRRFFEDTESLIKIIHQSLNLGEYPFVTFGWGNSTSGLADPKDITS